MTLRTELRLLHGFDDAEEVVPDSRDKELFEGPKESYEVLDHWHKRERCGHVIDYSKVRYAGGVYRFVRVDATVRKVIVDSDGIDGPSMN